MNNVLLLTFSTVEISCKPPDVSFMGRTLKMEFHVEDTGIDQYFTGKIVNYDGCIHVRENMEYTSLLMVRWCTYTQTMRMLFSSLD